MNNFWEGFEKQALNLNALKQYGPLAGEAALTAASVAAPVWYYTRKARGFGRKKNKVEK